MYRLSSAQQSLLVLFCPGSSWNKWIKGRERGAWRCQPWVQHEGECPVMVNTREQEWLGQGPSGHLAGSCRWLMM